MNLPPDPNKEAVALHYDGKNAPTITAKGEGLIAEQIIALAREHGVHLHEDANLLNLLATLELGEEIPRQLYVAIAEIIAYVYWVNDKVPG